MFLIRGNLDATNCVITQPLTGELLVESSDVAIKSMELQLVRVETCGEPHAANLDTLPPESVDAPSLPARSFFIKFYFKET